jgi:hypothetical protein
MISVSIYCHVLTFFLKKIQIPLALNRAGEGEPPPSWDPVSTPKGETLAVMC